MLIGSKIKTKRELAKLSQTELGEIIGVCQGTISNIEKNTGRPDFDIIVKICEALKLDIKEILPENSRIFNTTNCEGAQIQAGDGTINNNIDVEKIIAPLHETIKELLQQNATKDATIQKLLEKLASK